MSGISHGSTELSTEREKLEFESVPEFVGRTGTKKYEPNHMRWDNIPDDIVLFPDETSAIAAGFQPYKHKVKI